MKPAKKRNDIRRRRIVFYMVQIAWPAVIRLVEFRRWRLWTSHRDSGTWQLIAAFSSTIGQHGLIYANSSSVIGGKTAHVHFVKRQEEELVQQKGSCTRLFISIITHVTMIKRKGPCYSIWFIVRHASHIISPLILVEFLRRALRFVPVSCQNSPSILSSLWRRTISCRAV